MAENIMAFWTTRCRNRIHVSGEYPILRNVVVVRDACLIRIGSCVQVTKAKLCKINASNLAS